MPLVTFYIKNTQPRSFFRLTVSRKMLKNSQIFYNNLAVWAPPQDFESMFGHLTLLCVKGLKYRNEKSTAQKKQTLRFKRRSPNFTSNINPFLPNVSF